MALIGTIRNNGWILIALMVLALGGFILMDIMSNSQRYSAGDVNTLGKVNGVEIKRSEADTYEKLVYSNARSNPYQIRNQVWNHFVDQAIVKEVAEAIGIGVSKDELLDLEFGNNLSPIMTERFRGQDGQVNRAQLANIKSAIEGGQFTDPTNRAYWSVQEKEIVKERLQEKIITLVSKGVYTPSWQAEMAFKENNERIDFKYVRIGYEKVKDEEAQLSDADYKAYLSDNPVLYSQTEETRTISYVEFNVVPTSSDSMAPRADLAKLADGLRTAANDSSFVLANGGTYENVYKLKADLPVGVADTLLRLPLGSVVGPYLSNGEWGVAKILDRKVTPDSVKARHILIREPNKASEAKIDSLMGLLTSGKTGFDSLARKASQDPGSAAKGGDLGWFAQGMMVPEFNDICFNKAEQGKYYKVATQFGWHLIEVTGKKFIKNETGVKAVYLTKRIEPSKTTQQAVKDRAQALVQSAKTIDAFNTEAVKQSLNPQNSQPIKANDFALGTLGSGEDAREIIRWVFEEKTKVGSVSPQAFAFSDAAGGFFDSKYVVAVLKSIIPKGPVSVESAKNMPEVVAKVKNLKKAEILKSKIGTPSDLSAVASQYEAKVDTAKNATLLQGGGEPRMIGTAFSLANGSISAPIAGVNGVYIVQPITDKASLPVPADLTLFRRQVNSTTLSNIRLNLIKSMVKNAELVDNRSRFY